MEFNEWVALQIADGETRAKELKATIKEKVRAKDREGAIFFRTRLEEIESRIARFKSLKKIEAVKLQTGAIISISTLKAMHRKLRAAKWQLDLSQHPDGLKLDYTDGKTKGNLVITGFGIDEQIPDFVNIPIFTEGELKTCLADPGIKDGAF